jgi:hypothetical protein
MCLLEYTSAWIVCLIVFQMGVTFAYACAPSIAYCTESEVACGDTTVLFSRVSQHFFGYFPVHSPYVDLLCGNVLTGFQTCSLTVQGCMVCVLLLFFPCSLIISGFLFFPFLSIRMLISPTHEQLRRLLIHRASSFLLHCHDVFIHPVSYRKKITIKFGSEYVGLEYFDQ